MLFYNMFLHSIYAVILVVLEFLDNFQFSMTSISLLKFADNYNYASGILHIGYYELRCLLLDKVLKEKLQPLLSGSALAVINR